MLERRSEIGGVFAVRLPWEGLAQLYCCAWWLSEDHAFLVVGSGEQILLDRSIGLSSVQVSCAATYG